MTRLRRMDLDFACTQRGASWGGILALALGIAAAGLAITLYQEQLQRAARLEAELGTLGIQRRADAGGSRSVRTQGDAIVRANAVAQELARRWDRIFLAIESANAGDVALLGIEPDARKGVVRITAEAKGKNQMLDYLARLQAAQPLQRVMLEQHEVMAQAPERPVRFVVSAEWQTLP
jgi:hypothetical protein